MTIGIPAEAFDFYDLLAVENSREFWNAHKSEYEQNVREPLRELAAALEPDFGPAHLYRPYRDMRFSRDKTPIKDHQGCLLEGPNGLGWYLQISAEGLMAAGGWYQSTGEQVKRFRGALAEQGGEELRRAMKAATKGGFTIGGDQLKTRPRGVAEDDPDLDLYRYRTMHATRHWEPEAWMGTKRVERTLRTALEKLRPMIEVLGDMVGPAE
ncbi:MAG: DUF2461 domain-containing protein [Candidatus Nanopelagicales bacterium]